MNKKIKKFMLMWPDSGLSTKANHVNAPYHFIHMGEIVNFLNKKLDDSVDVLDIEACQIEFPLFMKRIIENKYLAIGMYLNTENLYNGLKLLDFIKTININCKVICYGDMPLYLPKFFKNTKFDAIVSKNCDQELALMDYFKYADSNDEKLLHDVFIVKNNQLILTKKGNKLDPDEWGFSLENEVPIDKYMEMEGKNQYVMTIARGCPYGCKYCNATSYYGSIERRRNISSIINFINNHNYEYYKFFAPNFTLNKKEVYKLCNEIINNGKKIKWSCTTRPDLLDDEELIKTMSLAGCIKIAVGIESISSKDLNYIDKRYNQKLISEGVKLTKKYNIKYKALVMFGVPNQSKESIYNTIEFLKKLNLEIRPTAYTPFYDMNFNMTAEQISKYDKRKYYDAIDDLSYADFLKLIYDTKNYKNILGRD